MLIKKLKNYIRLKGLQFFKANIIMTQSISLIDKNGKKYNTQTKVSESLTGNFLQRIYCMFANGSITDYPISNWNGGNNNTTTKNIIGGIGSCTGPLNLHPAAGVTNVGIVWGLNNIPPTPYDFQLASLITHGTGLNQLSYSIQNGSQIPTAIDATTSFKIFRVATNLSGLSITVNEVGIYAGPGDSINPGFCIYRDLVSGLVVPNGISITTEIIWTITT